MVNIDEPPPRPTVSTTGTHTRRLRWWVSAITLVVGFVCGVIAVGLLSFSTPEFAAQEGPGGTAGGASTPDGSVPVVAEARVNAACLAVINEAQDVYGVLTGIGQAVTDVDLQQLDDIVRRLQPIEARLGQDLQQCQVDTDLGANPPPSGGPQPTPLPGATPTR